MSAHDSIQNLLSQIDQRIGELRAYGSNGQDEIERWEACRRELENLVAPAAGGATPATIANNRVVPFRRGGHSAPKVSNG